MQQINERLNDTNLNKSNSERKWTQVNEDVSKWKLNKNQQTNKKKNKRQLENHENTQSPNLGPQ